MREMLCKPIESTKHAVMQDPPEHLTPLLQGDAHPAWPAVPLNQSALQRRGMRAQRGQAMTEYLIILALIAVAAIAVYQSFGQVIRSQTAGLARELAGESASQAVSAAKSASNEALKQKQSKTLKSYGTGSR